MQNTSTIQHIVLKCTFLTRQYTNSPTLKKKPITGAKQESKAIATINRCSVLAKKSYTSDLELPDFQHLERSDHFPT